MKEKIIILITLLLISICDIHAQTCDCGKDFSFLANSFVKDYSGIKDFSKLNPNYSESIEKLYQEAKSTNDILKCDKVIEKLIKYLNNGHVVYGPTKENPKFNILNPKPNNKSLDPDLIFLDNKTALITVKTCDISYKHLLDSLVFNNKVKLDLTEHFIIDVRGNEGGSDAMFDTLISYLYTNPILIHTAALWSSENNVKLFENYFADPNLPIESKNEIEKIIIKAKSKPNDFVLLSDNIVDTLILNLVATYPKKVSIIIDRNCKSSTEQFLLLAKQSKKTTIYGHENSGGALDYANLNFVLTPSGYWYASVPTTRSTRLPDNPVDPIGIAPDVLVKNNVKDLIQWVRKK